MICVLLLQVLNRSACKDVLSGTCVLMLVWLIGDGEWLKNRSSF